MMKQIREQSILYKDVPIARSGIYKYTGEELGVNPPNKVFNVLRDPKDYSQEFLDSLSLIPLLDDHHDGKYGASENKIGAIGSNARIDSQGKIITDVSVFDVDAEEKINMGKRELSMGFLSDILKEDGVYNGINYQYRQIPIKAEHVALVDEGRAGKEVKLHDERKSLDRKLFFDRCKFLNEDAMGETENDLTLSDLMKAMEEIKGMMAGLNERLTVVENSDKKMEDDGDELMAGADLSIIDPVKVGESVAEKLAADIPQAVELMVEQSLGQNIDLTEEQKSSIESSVQAIVPDVAETTTTIVETMQNNESEQMQNQDITKIQDAAISKLRKEEKLKESLLNNMNACGFKFSISAGETFAESSERARLKYCADTKAQIPSGVDMITLLTGVRITKRHYDSVTQEKKEVKAVNTTDTKSKNDTQFFEDFLSTILGDKL